MEQGVSQRHAFSHQSGFGLRSALGWNDGCGQAGGIVRQDPRSVAAPQSPEVAAAMSQSESGKLSINKFFAKKVLTF